MNETQDQHPMATPPVEAPASAAPVQAPVAADPNDPFSVDEARLSTFAPEQRAVLDDWKKRATEHIQKNGKTYEEKYKPHLDKAQALDELVKDPRFQSWWKNVQQGATAQNLTGQAVNSKPEDFATPEEWQAAVSEAYTGDPTRMKTIQGRMFAAMATPIVTQLKDSQDQLKAGQDALRQTLEMRDLFERHEDAKELDLVGRNPLDPNDKGQSLLQHCLEWAEKSGRPLEEGYQRAKSWSDSLKVGAQKQAMGMVQEKKQSVTSGPSTNQPGQSVVEVESADELMEKNMEYLASGQKPPRFVIKGRAPTGQWAQRA